MQLKVLLVLARKAIACCTLNEEVGASNLLTGLSPFSHVCSQMSYIHHFCLDSITDCSADSFEVYTLRFAQFLFMDFVVSAGYDERPVRELCCSKSVGGLH